MADAIVVDALVALARLHREAATPAVADAFRRWATAGERIVVPAHVWIELVDALAHGHRYLGADVVEAIRELDEIGLQTRELDRPGLLLALDAVERHGLAAGAAACLALAEALDARLATLDAGLATAAGPRAIFLGSTTDLERTSTRPAGRSSGASWPRWPGIGAEIARLRRAALERS